MTLIQPILLAQLADRFPEGVAWRNLANGEQLTLVSWHRRSNQLARGLLRHGLTAGERVALAIRPEDAFEWLISYMAIHKAGCVAVPINTRLNSLEMQRIFHQAEISGLLASASVLAALGDASPAELVAVVGSTSGSMLGWDALFDTDDTDVGIPLQVDDVADIMFTSGTTGAPKGVEVRHGGLSPSDRMPSSWFGLGFITASPFTTTSGSLLMCGPMRGGLSGWFLPSFDAALWLEIVAADRPVAGFLVPAMVQLLVVDPAFASTDLSSLAAVNIGSAPISIETLRRFQERLPTTDVMCGYGLTEFGAVTAMPPGDKGAHVGSVGRPLPGVSIRIENPVGMEQAAHDVGQILVRGVQPPRTMAGGAETTDGWLETGDLGFLGDDGYLWVVGRRKELIIRGGHNVVPGEVESVLFEHPDVVDVAVSAIPHDVLGEDVAAWVVLRPGSNDSVPALRVFMLQRLADYKVPRRITFVASLPRNEAGKVMKAQLVVGDEQRSTS